MESQAIVSIFVKLFLLFGSVQGFAILGYVQGKKIAIGSTAGLLIGMLVGLSIGITIAYYI